MADFFNPSVDTDNDYFTVIKFLTSCYSIRITRIPVRDNLEAAEDDDGNASGKLVVRHQIPDTEFRSTVIEFGKCFITGSING